MKCCGRTPSHAPRTRSTNDGKQNKSVSGKVGCLLIYASLTMNQIDAYAKIGVNFEGDDDICETNHFEYIAPAGRVRCYQLSICDTAFSTRIA